MISLTFDHKMLKIEAKNQKLGLYKMALNWIIWINSFITTEHLIIGSNCIVILFVKTKN